jgi:preprotein translocase subunit SecF
MLVQNRFATLLNNSGVDGAEIKSYGGNNQYLIRLKEFENADVTVQNAIDAQFQGVEYDVIKVDKIGPKIGSELYADALLAIFLAVLFILVYIAFRFEFNFGIGAVIALVHDVLLTFAIIVLVDHTGLINLEMNIITVAALLTVVGYSINDTVIVFDRIRENKEVHKGMNLHKMINMSINETLSRTVNTSVTTLIVLFVLLFFGGPVLEGFAFTMIIGIITGTYSSIFIASSFVILYTDKVLKPEVKETKKIKKPKVAKA